MLEAIDGLPLPELLLGLIAAGKWPLTADEALQQHSRSRVAEDRRRRLRKIYLFAPPFHATRDSTAPSKDGAYRRYDFFNPPAPELTIPIADFGMGADSPILLDYRLDRNNPRVIFLEWPGNGEPNYWAVLCENFGEFVDLLGL